MPAETSIQNSKLEADVRSAVEKGQDVQDKVRQLTLHMMSERSFDIKSLQQTAGAVLRGARAGVQKELAQTSAQTQLAQARLKEAVSGLDVALAQLAEAAKLAVQEAAGRAQRYTNEDLELARSDLKLLESMFIDTMQKSASDAMDATGDILRELAAHARTHGSAVGAQIRDTLDVIAHQVGAAGRAQVGAGLHLASNTANLLRKIAAGVLTGLADHVKPSPPKD
jgi:hypothetical protein